MGQKHHSSNSPINDVINHDYAHGVMQSHLCWDVLNWVIFRFSDFWSDRLSCRRFFDPVQRASLHRPRVNMMQCYLFSIKRRYHLRRLNYFRTWVKILKNSKIFRDFLILENKYFWRTLSSAKDFGPRFFWDLTDFCFLSLQKFSKIFKKFWFQGGQDVLNF